MADERQRDRADEEAQRHGGQFMTVQPRYQSRLGHSPHSSLPGGQETCLTKLVTRVASPLLTDPGRRSTPRESCENHKTALEPLDRRSARGPTMSLERRV